MKKLFILILAILFITTVHAQVGLNSDGSTPEPSAMLDVKSTTKGFLLPRMTSAQRAAISLPATGLLVFQTDEVKGYWYNQGTGETPDWKHLSGYELDGSETKLTAGANITISGSGTLASPYLVNATVTYGDLKQGIQSTDHSGWIKLDGRLKSSLTSTQQSQATALGIGTNIPDASNSFPVQNGTTLGSVSGSNSITIAQNQLPNLTWSGHIYQVAHGSYTGGSADGVFSRTGSGNIGNATGDGSTNTYGLSISLNGGVAQQALNITPKSLSVNMFIYLGF